MSEVPKENTKEDLLGLLASKYAPPAFTLVTEVPNGTSGQKNRSCDAMALGCWSSKGLVVHGFEVKHSRSDWQRELQDRAKAMAFERFVHHWWIVAVPGVVNLNELPAEWGLIEGTASGLKTRKAASLRTPEQMPLNMISALVRRAYGVSPEQAALKREYERGWLASQEHHRASAAREAEHRATVTERQFSSLKNAVAEFESAAGVQIANWSVSARKTGEAFRRFLTLPPPENLGNVSLRGLETLVADIKAFREAYAKEYGGTNHENCSA